MTSFRTFRLTATLTPSRLIPLSASSNRLVLLRPARRCLRDSKREVGSIGASTGLDLILGFNVFKKENQLDDAFFGFEASRERATNVR